MEQCAPSTLRPVFLRTCPPRRPGGARAPPPDAAPKGTRAGTAGGLRPPPPTPRQRDGACRPEPRPHPGRLPNGSPKGRTEGAKAPSDTPYLGFGFGFRTSTPTVLAAEMFRVRGSGFGTPLRGGRRKPLAGAIPDHQDPDMERVDGEVRPHRPLSQSSLTAARRVNSALCERGLRPRGRRVLH